MSESGRKNDGAGTAAPKDRWDLMPLWALKPVVKVLTNGAIKYGAWNWLKVEGAKDRYFAALMRHLEAWQNGEKDDPEWGLPHLAHAACNVLFLLAMELRGEQRNERAVTAASLYIKDSAP